MNAIINRLTDTLNARTEAALAQLAGLDKAIVEAITTAERTAGERIHAAQVQLDADTADRLAAFESTLAELAADALAKAAGMVLGRVETLAGHKDPASQSDQASEGSQPAEQTTEATEQDQTTADVLPAAVLLEMEPEPASTIPEAIPLPVAAHSLADSALGRLPEAEEEAAKLPAESDEESPPLAEASTEEIPNTTDPEGLHTRHGEGRQTRYEPADEPQPGEAYYHKHGRRWLRVRYVGR